MRFTCQDCGDSVDVPEHCEEWPCVLCGGEMKEVGENDKERLQHLIGKAENELEDAVENQEEQHQMYWLGKKRAYKKAMEVVYDE